MVRLVRRIYREAYAIWPLKTVTGYDSCKSRNISLPGNEVFDSPEDPLGPTAISTSEYI